MKIRKALRRYWPEVLLGLSVALPWLSLLGLGLLWLWQGGHVWAWAILAAAFGLASIPLRRLVRQRANADVRLALGDIAEPSRSWNTIEREAWSNVMAIADATPPFSFTETEPLVASARETVEGVARRFIQTPAARGRNSACPKSCYWASACAATCAWRPSVISLG